jgi:hypothetical protein
MAKNQLLSEYKVSFRGWFMDEVYLNMKEWRGRGKVAGSNF